MGRFNNTYRIEGRRLIKRTAYNSATTHLRFDDVTAQITSDRVCFTMTALSYTPLKQRILKATCLQGQICLIT